MRKKSVSKSEIMRTSYDSRDGPESEKVRKRQFEGEEVARRDTKHLKIRTSLQVAFLRPPWYLDCF